MRQHYLSTHAEIDEFCKAHGIISQGATLGRVDTVGKYVQCVSLYRDHQINTTPIVWISPDAGAHQSIYVCSDGRIYVAPNYVDYPCSRYDLVYAVTVVSKRRGLLARRLFDCRQMVSTPQKRLALMAKVYADAPFTP